MHGSTMIYLFVTPMAIAMAMYLVPLQIGAVAVSGARLALAGFWIWLSRRADHAVGLADRRAAPGATAGRPTRRCRTGPTRRASGRTCGSIGVILVALGLIADGGVRAGHDRAPARARDVAAADAGVHLDRAGQRADGGRRVPDAGPGDGAAVHRPPRRPHLHRVHRRDRLPGPVLVLRAPGRVRDVLPVPGSGGRGDRGGRAQAVVRLRRVRRLDHGVRGAVDGGLVAPHVHDRRRHQPVLRVHLDAAAWCRPGSSTST